MLSAKMKKVRGTKTKVSTDQKKLKQSTISHFFAKVNEKTDDEIRLIQETESGDSGVFSTDGDIESSPNTDRRCQKLETLLEQLDKSPPDQIENAKKKRKICLSSKRKLCNDTILTNKDDQILTDITNADVSNAVKDLTAKDISYKCKSQENNTLNSDLKIDKQRTVMTSDHKHYDTSHTYGTLTESSKCITEDNVHSDLVDIENLDSLFLDNWDSNSEELDLSTWKYCKVLSVLCKGYEVILHLKEHVKGQNRNATCTCILKGYWVHVTLAVGDVLSVIATRATTVWCVDDKAGFVVKHPDKMVTGTGIADSVFCARRSVLSSLFPSRQTSNSCMVVGSLAHELFQEVLRKKIYDEDGMNLIVAELMSHHRTLVYAYESGISIDEIKTELKGYLPSIRNFVDCYILQKGKSKDKTWSGKILDIVSIEENFWTPEMGMKGKTDLIVRVQIGEEIKVMPLELKTGRASNSSEHRGQLILYIMMMSLIGVDVDSGLLLYIRDNKMYDIKPSRAERCGLISMRNEQVDYLHEYSMPKFSHDGSGIAPRLPEPISHRSGCAKCDHLIICSSALKYGNTVIPPENSLNALSEKATDHLTIQHMQYVFRWSALLKLEEQERTKQNKVNVSDIWHIDANTRENRGGCIAHMVVTQVEEISTKFLHWMRRAKNYADKQLNVSDFKENDYIVVNTDKRAAIAVGYVNHISETEVVLLIDRNLNASEDVVYSLDRYSSFDTIVRFNCSSLAIILEDSERASRLRSLIVDQEIPKFSKINEEELLKNNSDIFDVLNAMQQKAILRTLTAEDYFLIKGLPGTGKTATVAALIRLLVRLKYSVLVTSHTHSAVDNILMKLVDVNFLRLGSSLRVHPALHSRCETVALKNFPMKTVEEMENFYNSKPVVGVTCIGCSHTLFKKRTFDFCIVDEATQVLQPSTLVALYSARKFILIGDPKQLPPVVQNLEAKLRGLDESLFSRLDRPEVRSELSIQYRMNQSIMTLANLFTYENKLECGHVSVSNATINLIQKNLRHEWLQLVCSNELHHSVVMLNTIIKREEHNFKWSNKIEADIAFTIVETFTKAGVAEDQIGLIAPYTEQVELLKTISNKHCFEGIEINTVDQYQGRDKDIVIISLTRCSQFKENGGILCDKRRLTVAITRAKRKLIIIGNLDVLREYEEISQLISFIPRDNIVSLQV